MADKLVITAALCGGATRKEQNPNVPYTPEEFAREASRAEEAGAAVVHIHFRDPATGLPSADTELIDDVVQAVQENTGVLINISTGFQGPMLAMETRKLGIERHSPDMASLNPGTMNFCFVNHKTGDIIYDFTFENPMNMTIEYGKLMHEKGIKPELECFALSHVQNALFLAKHYDFLVQPLHFSIVMGTTGGVPFSPDIISSFIHMLPPGATWQGIGVGPFCFPVAMASAIHGGHIRVGLEDNIYVDYTTKELSKGNWDQVEKAVQIARIAGREVATVEEARVIYNLPEKPQQ
jgi:3-keto-5-aminohexanoate cleavage enzyme